MSRVSPISFGRVIRVHAPANIAKNIGEIANGWRHSKISDEIKKIFPDKEQGWGRVIQANVWNNGHFDSYLISGNDATNVIDFQKSPHGSSSDYRQFIDKYIAKHKDKREMTVAHNGYTIKAIDMTLPEL